MGKPFSVVLVEDHVIVRYGLKELIEHMGAYVVTGEFDNGRQLIEKIDDLSPDIILMDLSMPVMDGHATMKWLKEHDIPYPVLILTLDTSEKAIIELYKSGVRGYLPKTCTADTLKKAIDDIIANGYYHNELLTNALLKQGSLSPSEMREEFFSKLTDRELEFLKLVCDKEEYTYDQIGNLMEVHRRTVDNYRESLFRKFDIKSKTGLVLLAIKHGIISV